MGLFSTLGKIAGGFLGGPVGSILGAVAPTVIGGFLNRKENDRAQGRAVSDQIASLPRLRQSAEAAGFNPLTALLAGGGSGFGQTGVGPAPLASIAAISNSVTGVMDVFTGEAEKRRNREQVQDELASLALERAKAGQAGRIAAATAGVMRRPPKKEQVVPVSGDMRAFGPLAFGSPSGGVGKVDLTEPEDVVRQHVGPLQQSFTTRTGNRISVPVGPDIDELVSGAVLDFVANNEGVVRKMKDAAKFGLLGGFGFQSLGPVLSESGGSMMPGSPPRRRNSPSRVGRKSDQKTREFMRDNFPTVFDKKGG